MTTIGDKKPDNEILEHLKQQTGSDSFCMAKWYNATIWLGSGMTTSCHHPPAHKIDVDKVTSCPSQLHNTSEKKEDRRKMLNGERPAGCEYCWKIEDMPASNQVSDRVYKSKIYSEEALTEAKNTPYDQNVNLKTLEIAFDRTCNFACSYCNPAFSTTWAKDIKNNGGYKDLQSDGRNHFTHTHASVQPYGIEDENPYVEAFFAWWEDGLKDTLEELRITGGEPMMSRDFWRLLQWYEDYPDFVNPDMRFAVNSNLGGKKDLIDKLIAATHRVPKFHVYTSCESLGAHAEYIRDGLVWEEFKANVLRMINEADLEGLHMMCTVNALCLESLPEFLDWIMELKGTHGKDMPNFTLNILRFPSFQSPLVLPTDIKQAHKDRLSTWLQINRSSSLLHDMEINHVERLIQYLDSVATPHSETFEMPKLHNDFKQFYQQYDVRRNKNFVQTFPGLANWFNTL